MHFKEAGTLTSSFNHPLSDAFHKSRVYREPHLIIIKIIYIWNYKLQGFYLLWVLPKRDSDQLNMPMLVSGYLSIKSQREVAYSFFSLICEASQMQKMPSLLFIVSFCRRQNRKCNSLNCIAHKRGQLLACGFIQHRYWNKDVVRGLVCVTALSHVFSGNISAHKPSWL